MHQPLNDRMIRKIAEYQYAERCEQEALRNLRGRRLASAVGLAFFAWVILYLGGHIVWSILR